MKSKKSNYSLTYPKIVAIGFACLILIGSGLLMLPISSKTGSVSYVDALFAATSATCITGLVPFDTYTNWTTFGQVVLICLIQIGGLGFITVVSLLSRMLKRKMSLKQKMLLKESVGSLNLGDVKKLVKSVIIFTASCEGAASLLLMTKFIPMAGVGKGIYMSIFTSISAYCNAGFDLMGMYSPGSSLTTVNDDPIIILTLSLLIIFGGLGFVVWQDMKECRFKFSAFSSYSKLVLIATAILLFGGAGLFFVFEYNETFAGMNLGVKLLNAFFCSVTPRTAGFNSVDIAAMSSPSKMLTIILMFIGGGTGSTAGGVKVSTIAVLFLCVITEMRNKDDINVFDRRVTLQVVRRAVSIALINFSLVFISTVAICIIQPAFTLVETLFETVSAMGTVGMTMGITSHLNVASQLIIIALMYIGRLTSLIFALSFVRTKAKTTAQKPVGNIMIG